MDKQESIWGRSFDKAPLPYWLASTDKTSYPVLREDLDVDVAIVGGGMVGITSAYLLKKAGFKVAVLEAENILQGTTAHTTAKITSQHDLIYDKLKNQFGMEKAKQYAEANETAISFINKIIEENEIDCDFSWQPSYIYTNSEEYIEQIQNEVKTASALGIKASYQEETPLPFKVKAAVRFDGQAQFHPRKYLLALAAKIPGQGSNIFEQTKAVDIEEENGCTVITDSGIRVHASKVIIASHYPFYDKPGLYFTRIYPDRSYILAVRAKSKYPGGMYINAEQPARSLRSQPYENGELILVGGEHHKTGHGENTNQHYENLLSFAEDTFGVISVPYRWSTQDCMTMDGVPYIGHLTSNKKDIYVATGFQKWGMTSSTVSALIIRDLIMEGDNPWKEVFDPSRTTIAASAKNFIKENADVAGNFISGKLMSVPENLDVKKGEGKIMDIDGYKTGVYRDSDDKLHFVDTSCTHLGCGLKWNDAEKTWDCPCHGSRFGYTGDIVEGPALKSIGIELKEKMYS